MDFLIKIGDKRNKLDPAWASDWKDGHIIDIREEHKWSKAELQHFAVLRFPAKYEFTTTQKKQAYSSFLDIKKYIGVPDSTYKMSWELYAKDDEQFTDHLKRLYFFDLKYLVDQKILTEDIYKSVYDKAQAVEPIIIDRDFTLLLKNEVDNTRVVSELAEKTIGTIDAAGTYTVGTAQTYSTWSAAIADLPADIGAMTTPGDITLRGNVSEEITESTVMTISLDTDIYTLTLDVASGVKHNGGAYGNGHRINLTSGDYLYVNGSATTNKVNFKDFEIDNSGSANRGIRFGTCGDNTNGQFIVERCVIKGDSTSRHGIYRIYNYPKGKHIYRNNVIYGHTSTTNVEDGNGIYTSEAFSSATQYVYLYNNTCVGNTYGIQSAGNDADMVTTLKNNLCVGNGTADYYFPDAEPAVTEKNVSGDSTSPDGATYQSWAGTANMIDYDNNDFRLDGADTTLDDGDDLSAVGAPHQFGDDIQGQTRSTWYIGASEYVASGVTLTVAGSLSSAGAVSRMIHVARTYAGELMEWTRQLFNGWRQYVFNSMAQNFSEGR